MTNANALIFPRPAEKEFGRDIIIYLCLILHNKSATLCGFPQNVVLKILTETA